MEVDGSNFSKKSRERYYPSDVVGNPVVNAVTGAKYPWRVGKKEEDRFFKVIDTANNVGFGNLDYGCRVSHKLYYETPYQYMTHRNIELSDDFIKAWYTKQNAKYPGEFIYVNKSNS